MLSQGSSSLSSAGSAASSPSTSSSSASFRRGRPPGRQGWNRKNLLPEGTSPVPSSDQRLASTSSTKETRVTTLRVLANHYKLNIPQDIVVCHYNVATWNRKEGLDMPAEPKRLPTCDKRRIFAAFASTSAIRQPIFDGQNALYLNQPLEANDKTSTVLLRREKGEQDDEFCVRIWAEEPGPAGGGTPLVQVLDIAIRCALAHGRESLGRLLLTRDQTQPYHGGPSKASNRKTKQSEAPNTGEALYCGILTSVRSGQSDMFVNADTLQTVLYKPDSLLNLVQDLLHRPISTRDKLSDEDIDLLNKRLKRITVCVKHLSYRRTRKLETIVKQGADEMHIAPAGSDAGGPADGVTVAEYFNKYGGLKYPRLPCVKVQSKRECYYPLEVCFIPLQRGTQEMSGNTVNPNVRFERAGEVIKELRNNSNRMAGFVFDVSPTAVEINAKVLPKEIGDPTKDHLENVGWAIVNMRDKHVSLSSIEQLRDTLIQEARYLGVQLSERPYIDLDRRLEPVEESLKDFKRNISGAFIVVLLDEKDTRYSAIKYHAETKLGLITQCIAFSVGKFSKAGICRNVMHKIKAKLGFINKTMPLKINQFDFKEIMVMGADVSHRSPNDGRRSVAPIVGSINAHASRYVAAISLQGDDSRVEIIKDMGSMVGRILDVYWKNRKSAPKAILFYRDGVSEGQYSQVRDRELPWLDAECKKAFPGFPVPKITFVTVQKRHRTRFMLANPVGRNVSPGTVVDTVITHPSQQEFFMCSHTPITGTARPAHYHVIQDENGFDPETLQKITFSLCHMFARCDKPVSIPTPVYYAHLAAARGSCYLKAHEKHTGRNECDANVVQPTHNLKDQMFFI